MASRKIKLVSLKDSHVVEFTDGGLVKGEPSSGRWALLRVLDKRVEVDGKRLPLCLLAEVPSLVDPDFDERNFQDKGGEWILAHKQEAWAKVRSSFISEAKRKADEASDIAAQRIGGTIAGNMVDLVKGLSQPAVRPAASKSKGVDA